MGSRIDGPMIGLLKAAGMMDEIATCVDPDS